MSTLTPTQRYLFDLQGYLIIRNVLTPTDLQAANQAIDQRAHTMIERHHTDLRNATEGTLFYGTGTGRKDLGRVLEWPESNADIFRRILAHPKLVPLFHGILGQGYRLDHFPVVIAQDRGSEGFRLHGGTIDCESGEYNPSVAYSCKNGKVHSALLGVSVVLTDHDAGSGGFCIVPGSHKSEFPIPDPMTDGALEECMIQPITKAGDVVLFGEGTVHGALPWTREEQRRVCLYRFAPGTCAYGRSYFNEPEGKMGWPENIVQQLTVAEKAVLQPPFNNRLDRVVIEDVEKGTVERVRRGETKRTHDRDVFGTEYF